MHEQKYLQYKAGGLYVYKLGKLSINLISKFISI